MKGNRDLNAKLTGQRLADSARSARAQAQPEGATSKLRLGSIASVGTAGDYTVSVLGATGAAVDSIPGVRAWGSATYNVGDRVFLAYVGDRPIPFILSAGGSGGDGEAINANITGQIRFFTSG